MTLESERGPTKAAEWTHCQGSKALFLMSARTKPLEWPPVNCQHVAPSCCHSCHTLANGIIATAISLPEPLPRKTRLVCRFINSVCLECEYLTRLSECRDPEQQHSFKKSASWRSRRGSSSDARVAHLFANRCRLKIQHQAAEKQQANLACRVHVPWLCRVGPTPRSWMGRGVNCRRGLYCEAPLGIEHS